MGLMPERKAFLREHPAGHRAALGGVLVLLFLEGALIVGEAGHVVFLLILWLASFPVVQFAACRKCANCGHRCPVPGEGEFAGLFFKPSEAPGSPGFWGFAGVALCYAMRLAYPAIFLLLNPEEGGFWLWAVYGFTVVLYFYLLVHVFGCPNCVHADCPLNPGGRSGKEGEDM